MTKTKERCPCYQCLCIPVCRLKSYIKLKTQCDLISNYLFMKSGERRVQFDRLIKTTSDILDPCWYALGDRRHVVILHLKGIQKNDTM